jgi:hypothetical protein
MGIRILGDQEIRISRDRENTRWEDGQIARKGDQEISEFITKIKTQTSKSLPAVGRQTSNFKIQTKYPIRSE